MKMKLEADYGLKMKVQQNKFLEKIENEKREQQ